MYHWRPQIIQENIWIQDAQKSAQMAKMRQANLEWEEVTGLLTSGTMESEFWLNVELKTGKVIVMQCPVSLNFCRHRCIVGKIMDFPDLKLNRIAIFELFDDSCMRIYGFFSK